jgi:hypothetical protein
MKLDQFLGKQLQDVLTVYKTLFKKTFGITIILSFLCLLFIAALHIYCADAENTGAKTSLLSYLWYRYSSANSYNLVDMSKSVFLFVISFFSIAISRKLIRDKENMNVKLGSFFDEMRPTDFGFLLMALIACLVIDYLLHQLGTLALANILNQPFGQWVYYQLYYLRIYLPLFIFSYTSRLALTNSRSVFTLKECLFLFISFWLINEVAFEFTLFMRGHVFQLLLIPVPEESKFFVESVFALPLIAVLFLGYHCAMTNAVLIFQSNAESDLFSEKETAGSI